MKKILLLVILCVLLSSCVKKLIWVCVENERNFKNSLLYTNQTPLTIPEFKDLVLSDTSRYKFVFFFSPCCGGVTPATKTIFRPYYEQCDTTKVNVIFLSSGYGDVKYNEEFFQYMGFMPKIYYLRDSTGTFYDYKNGELSFEKEDYNNMLNYIFPTDSFHISLIGTPMTFIISKDNKLKRAVYTYKYRKKKDLQAVEPMYLGDMDSYDLDKIDFLVIDECTIMAD